MGDLSYLYLYLCYLKDLGVYFHIFEVKDHKNDITNTAISSVDLQIQGHKLFCVIFYIFVYLCAIGENSMSISTYLRSRITMMI